MTQPVQERRPEGEADHLDQEADRAAERGDYERAEQLRRAAREARRQEPDPMTPAEAASLVMATKGERFNYDHLGRVLAARLRLKEGR